jgi:tRNA 5-methylaminomethyl-2-thiouridine biosynthesis bifunctional protein
VSALADIDWRPDGTLRSRRFDDIYFSRAGGLDESGAVFLAGCGLPQVWRGRRRFTVGELGFGTGLNILALLQLWRQAREPGARLSVFSVEAFPLAAADAAQALAAWPELSDLAAVLLDAWPQAPGFHRVEFLELDATLDLAILEAAPALKAWQGRADAWFLDGFSPAKNPAMWRDEVLELMAARSAPGARAASFTVAGAVRRGLSAQGFAVAKRAGFGGKAERLEAVRGEREAEAPSPRRVCILGAGIAGAALARAFAAQGVRPLLFDANGTGAGASGNPAALVTPRLDAGGGPPARLYAQAFRRAGQLYGELPQAVLARGALQLEAAPRDGPRFDKVLDGGLFEPGALERLDAAEMAARLGEPADSGGLWIRDGLVVEPRVILDAWLAGAEFRSGEAAKVERTGEGWRVLGPAGQVLAQADILCLATGLAVADLAPHAPLEPIRGQASFARWPEPPTPAAWGGYVIPTREGLLFGATHDRGDTALDLRPADHARNLQTLARKRPGLAEALAGASLDGRAGVRAAAPDRLPLAGEVGDGLFVLAGLGGRGFCLAPLLAEHIVALALGAPSPLPDDLAQAVQALRFSPRSDPAGHLTASQENAP